MVSFAAIMPPFCVSAEVRLAEIPEKGKKSEGSSYSYLAILLVLPVVAAGVVAYYIFR